MMLSNLEIDTEAFRLEKQKNFQERLWFISYWASRLAILSDSEWTGMQADFINAQFER